MINNKNNGSSSAIQLRLQQEPQKQENLKPEEKTGLENFLGKALPKKTIELLIQGNPKELTTLTKNSNYSNELRFLASVINPDRSEQYLSKAARPVFFNEQSRKDNDSKEEKLEHTTEVGA